MKSGSFGRRSFLVSFGLFSMLLGTEADARPFAACAQMPVEKSTAYNPDTKRIDVPWRTDLPATPAIDRPHAWTAVPLADWQAYMAAVLSEVKAADLSIRSGAIAMRSDAEWWIAPWMDYTANGRERNLGLTRERSPAAGDLAPTSPEGLQVWAVGFYNHEGAHGLAQVFAQPCDPFIPSANWVLPDHTASFKLLFTTATGEHVPYLEGAPEVRAFIDGPNGEREEQTLRLIQVDISVRDPRSATGWVLGTFVWKGPKVGDGLFHNLVPVGLMWGNDPLAKAESRDDFTELEETRLNQDLVGVLWRGPGQMWAERPWPGFQGRLNGPADNLRSTCMSCHALAQWPVSRALSIVPNAARYSLDKLGDAAVRDELRAKYMTNVVGGKLTIPSEADPATGWGGAVALDYSLQIEAAFRRLCQACKEGVLEGATPRVCRVEGQRFFVPSATCPVDVPEALLESMRADDEPPRQ